MDRRSLLTAAVAGLFGTRLLPFAVAPALAQEPAAPFGFDAVVALARAAAAEAYARPLMEMAPPFADLRYDAFRAIRFREDRRLFADGSRAFQMELLPPGHHFQDRIEINLVAADGRVQPVAFSTDYFDFHPDYFPFPDGRAPAGLAEEMGFSGMRFRFPLNRPGVWDEVAVFQGASYFRAVAHDTLFGLSARGLAIGTATPEPEEFPIFKSFWVHEPRAGDARAPPAGAARQRVGRRRLRLPHRARAGDRDADRGGPVPAPGDRLGRHRALDLDVLLRAGEPRRRRRLPRRRARQRRPPDRQRLRRADLAAAPEPGGRRDLGLQRPEPARLRSDPAGADVRALLRRRGALRAAPLGLGRARGRLGRRRGGARRAAVGRRVHRQHRRLLAAGRPADRRLRAPLRLPAELRRDAARRRARSPASSAPAAASRSSTDASGSSSSTSISA